MAQRLNGGMHADDERASAGHTAQVLARRGDRRRMMRALGAIVALATVAILLKALLTPAAGPAPGAKPLTPLPAAPQIGHLAPVVSLEGLDGKPLSLADLHGKVVVLNFWYVNCEPCRLEMPALQRVYDAQRARGLVVLGVNTADDVVTVRNFAQQIGVGYPLALDADLRTTVSYRIVDTPTTFVIDRDGVIRYKTVGPVDRAELERETAGLLVES